MPHRRKCSRNRKAFTRAVVSPTKLLQIRPRVSQPMLIARRVSNNLCSGNLVCVESYRSGGLFYGLNQSTPTHSSHAAFHFRPSVAQTQGIPLLFDRLLRRLVEPAFAACWELTAACCTATARGDTDTARSMNRGCFSIGATYGKRTGTT